MKKLTFNEKIYSILKKVPKGKVITYKDLAHRAGTRAYRAVGTALKNNPYAPLVPCHRVVKSDGFIGGFLGSNDPKSKEVKKKIKMLRKEGITIKNNKISDDGDFV
jgi:methylated-DNA-[protein]-cysteine S-methyltransferase